MAFSFSSDLNIKDPDNDTAKVGVESNIKSVSNFVALSLALELASAKPVNFEVSEELIDRCRRLVDNVSSTNELKCCDLGFCVVLFSDERL